MISATAFPARRLISLASATAYFVFPEAVGPMTQMMSISPEIYLLYISPTSIFSAGGSGACGGMGVKFFFIFALDSFAPHKMAGIYPFEFSDYGDKFINLRTITQPAGECFDWEGRPPLYFEAGGKRYAESKKQCRDKEP